VIPARVRVHNPHPGLWWF